MTFSLWTLVLPVILGIVSASGQPLNESPDLTGEKCGLPTVVAALHDAINNQAGDRTAWRSPFQRTERQKSFVSGKVRVHYDTSGTDAAAMLDEFFRPIPGTADEFADSVAAIANSAWTSEASLGYLSPPDDQGAGGGTEYDVYISNLGNLYGQTFTETALDTKPDGGKWTTYLEVDNDFVFVSPSTNRGLPALRVTLAHELHHAIQLGGYGLWLDHIYYYEITSTWIEDVLFTEVNDYYVYLSSSQSQFRMPEVEFNSNNFIEYSRAIWNHFVAKRFGPDVVRRSWELISGVPPLQAIDAALAEEPYRSSFQDAFTEWALWNYFTGNRHQDAYYPEGSNYPLITEIQDAFQPPLDTLSNTLPPLATRYHTISSGSAPLTLSISNIDLVGAGLGQSYSYKALLAASPPDSEYAQTLSGVYVKLDLENPSDWSTWAIVNGLASKLGEAVPIAVQGSPFPNPFFADGSVSIPVGSSSSITGDLVIFSSDMDRVFSQTVTSQSLGGIQVMQWEGKHDNGENAGSGIYLYVIGLPDRVLTGKLAIIRR